jgi:hypothetical protein
MLWQQRREHRYSQLSWIVDTARGRRDLFEQQGDLKRAEALDADADALFVGLAALQTRQSVGGLRREEVRQAAMKASGDDWLRSIGVSECTTNHLPAKHSLYWLAGQFSERR